ncbi:MAG: DMT family transporter [Pseudomonadota bacterium]
MSADSTPGQIPSKAPSHDLRGIILIVLSMGCFIANDGLMKSLGDYLAWHQALALRGVIAAVLGIGLALAIDGRRPAGEIIAYLRNIPCLLRLVFEILSTALYLTAIFNMPLAGATAINQLVPVLLTIGGALFLREQVGWRRYAAAGAGFLGVMLIIQPGTSEFTPFALFALAGTCTMAARDLVTRKLPPGIPSTYVAAMTVIAVAIMGQIVALNSDWPPIEPWMLLHVTLAAVAVSLAFLFGVMAVRLAEVSLLAPFRFTSLIWGLLIGVLAFGERPGALTLLGAAIVIGAGLYILYRERMIGRRRARPSPV